MQQENWPKHLDWMVSTLEGFDRTFRPRLGRTGALAKDLKQQVKLLRRDYKEIAEVLRGV